MNPPSKPSQGKKLPNVRFSLRFAPSVLDSVPEVGEREVQSLSKDKMSAPIKQSRLRRFTQHLPKLNTNSKPQKDTHHLPVPRKQVPRRDVPPQAPDRAPPNLPPQYELPPRTQTNEIPPLSQANEIPPLNSPPPYTGAPHKLQKPHQQEIPPLNQANYTSNETINIPNPAHQLHKQPVLPPSQLPLPRSRSPTGHAHPGPGRPRGNSLAPPNTQSEYGSRSVSTPLPIVGRPTSYHSEGESDKGNSKIRKSFLGGKKSRNTSQDLGQLSSYAWVNAGSTKIDYNINFLFEGEKVPELWNDAADTFVYLFPRETGRGPQFRVPSTVLWSSQLLVSMIRGDGEQGRARGKSFGGRSSLAIEDATRNLALRGIGTPPYTPKQGPSDNQSMSDSSGESIRSFSDAPLRYHLYFPIGLMSAGPPYSTEDVQRLVEVRNLFALLTGQPLIVIRTCPTNFRMFLAVAALLRKFEFASEDGSSFGQAVDVAFSFILKDMPQLIDCRESRETTLEALVLGEAMKSTELYNEAFAHAVGKYDEFSLLKSPIFDLVSQLSRNRLEKASLDLKSRLRAVNDRLTDFEFPSLFAGIAASTSRAESKVISFKSWKSQFLNMRKQVLSYYKDLHGQWPPKASSKKNNFIEGGLNRLVLKGFYSDLCDLYDFLADREALTTRVYNGDGSEEAINVSPVSAALRKLLDEYDRSSPPVQPPIPFDIPLIPTVKSIDPNYFMLSPKDQHKASNRKLKDYETQLVLAKSHNLDADYKSPFLEMYKAFEASQSKGKNAVQLSEQRHGHWIFMYACLQSLPLLTTDAPGLQYTDGVEYFLCQVPLGNLPWLDDQSQVKMSWFTVTGGQHIVSLPSDVVKHGVEATYRRSHCWTIAQKWIGADFAPVDSIERETLSPLSPPPGFDGGGELSLRPSVRSRNRTTSEVGSRHSTHGGLSPGDMDHRRSKSRQSQRNSIAFGLERLPSDATYNSGPAPGMRATSRGPSPAPRSTNSRARDTPPLQQNTGSTFDDILGNISQEGKCAKGKKGRK